MKLSLIATIVLAGGLAGACATPITSVRAGMTEADVVESLGKPDDRRVQGRLMELTYAREAVAGFNLRGLETRRSDYYVRLSDGKVVAYGPVAQRRTRPSS